MSITIRSEIPSDNLMIRQVNEAAFGGLEEANLVDALRAEGDVLLSLVAERGCQVVGHILLSRTWIETASRKIDAERGPIRR